MKTSIRKAAAEGLTNFSTLRNSVPLGILLLIFLMSSCHENTNGQDQQTNKKDVSPGKGKRDTVKPKVTVNVNRRYDDKGNLIGFDSTYSSYYSNVQGDTAKMDSLFSSFDQYFNAGRPSLLNDEFNSLFFRDSIMYPDFFHDDFFMKRYELNDPYMRKMMSQMDSIKNRFYEQQSRRRKTPQKK